MPKTIRANRQRAEQAEETLLQYAEECGEELWDDPKTVLIDLLTDLLHYCDSNEIDFDTALDQSKGHYIAEVEGHT